MPLDDGTATLRAINSYATNAVSARILNNLIAIRSFEEKWISNKPELGPKRRPVGSPAVIDLQCAFGGIKSFAFAGLRVKINLARATLNPAEGAARDR